MKSLAWKQIIVTFAIAFVLGAALGRFEFAHHMHGKWKDPAERQKWILKRLDDGLHLNGQQETQIAAILQESAVQMEAVHSKVRPELEALRKQTREKIEPLLTPEQKSKYEQMEAEWQERRQKYRDSLAAPHATQPA